MHAGFRANWLCTLRANVQQQLALRAHAHRNCKSINQRGWIVCAASTVDESLAWMLELSSTFNDAEATARWMAGTCESGALSVQGQTVDNVRSL